jgi:hypothetical protein
MKKLKEKLYILKIMNQIFLQKIFLINKIIRIILIILDLY